MVKNFIVFLICILGIRFSNAQTTFQKTFGGANDDGGTSIVQTTDGGYIIAGYTKSFGTGTTNLYLIKTDLNGNSTWNKTYDNLGSTKQTVMQTSDGGFILSNYFSLIKTNSLGDTIWTKRYTVTGNNFFINFVQQCSDGGYIATGQAYSSTSTSYEVALVKTDINGNLVWTKTYAGNQTDNGEAVQQTSDGGYIIGGSTYSFIPIHSDFYIIKTNNAGDTLWTKVYGGAGYDFLYSLKETNDGGYLAVGSYDETFIPTGTLTTDIYIIKTNSFGDTLWTRTYGGPGYQEGHFGEQTSDGGYIITGYTSSVSGGNQDVFLLKLDPNGNQVWSNKYGGTSLDNGNTVHQTNDGGYIISGITGSFGSGNNDLFIIRADSIGNSFCNQNTATFNNNSAPTTIRNTTTIMSSGGVSIGTTLSIDSGIIEITLCFTIGIEENKNKNQINIYPNPFYSSATVEIEEFNTNKYDLCVFDLSGREVVKYEINSKKVEIQMGSLSKGMYFYKVKDETKIISAGKLILQ